MNFFKRITAFLLCLVMLISLFGCKAKENVLNTIAQINEADPGLDEIGYTVPYLRSDTLNPFDTETGMNLDISTLLYDSLFSVDNTFKALPLMAEKSANTEDGLQVKIKALKFTDGTQVTADDVVYSFKKAKKSANYSIYLGNIKNAEAIDGLTVLFSLYNPNIYEKANLIFPVIKAKSDIDRESSDDYSAKVPTGSGRYSVKSENDIKYLAVNKERLGDYHPKYNKIGLKDLTELSSVQNLFSMGEIDYYTESFSDGTFKRYTGNASAISTTNFTFLGVSNYKSALQKSSVRRAIALLINRADLASVSYAGFAVAASTPFNPDFYALEGCIYPSAKQDKARAIELLEEAGYDKINDIGIRNNGYSALNLRLVVNKENSFRLAMARSIQQALSKADINVEIRELSYNSYISAIQNGAFDLFVGEAKLSNSFDLSEFFNEDGSLSYGVCQECDSQKAYRQFKKSEINLQSFLDTFSDDLPFIPLAYRQNIAVRSDKIKTEPKITVSDRFLNIDEWTVK